MRRILSARFHAQVIFVIPALLIILLLPIPSLAQPCNPVNKERRKAIYQTVDLLRVVFVVHGKKGEDVGELRPGDFVVLADGAPQRVTAFHSLGQNENTCTGIIIDRSKSRQSTLPNAEIAPIEKFLNSGVDSNHGAFLAGFNDRPISMGGYSTDATELGRELLNLGSVELRGGTAMHDAIKWSASKLANVEGYRIVLIVAEGNDNDSRSTAEDAIDDVLKASTTVYFMRLQPDSSNMETRNASEFTKKITVETGGEVFPVHKKDDFEKAFAEFKEDISNLYDIGFLLPTNLKKNTVLHTLEIKTTRKGLRVIAPTKFYLPNQERAVTANRGK